MTWEFQKLKILHNLEEFSLGKLLQHPGEIQLFDTNAEAFEILLEVGARISQFDHLHFPGPHSAHWLKFPAWVVPPAPRNFLIL